MRKAIQLWETSRYWEQRAAGAIRHAKYKELPAVRHRRIKDLERDLRKHTKHAELSRAFLAAWQKLGDDVSREAALKLSAVDSVGAWFELDREKITPVEARTRAIAAHERWIAHDERWIAHLTNRIAYERAMLGESGGIAADKFQIEPGGRVLVRGRWCVVERVNRSAGGAISSVSLLGQGWPQGIETVTDYREPAEGDAEKVQAITKLAPLVNYDGEGFLRMTSEEWKRKQRSQSGIVKRADATETHGAYRYRSAIAPGGSFRTATVFLTDAPVKERPTVATPAPPQALPVPLPDVSAIEGATRALAARQARAAARKADAAPFDALKERFKGGIKVVVNPDLFPTPPELAERVVARADVYGKTVIEPSAGTGALANVIAGVPAELLCIERDLDCCQQLTAMGHEVIYGDFLEYEPGARTFDRVVMNPPFSGGRDVLHILRAWKLVAPGGRLVAIASAGVKFRRDKATRAFRALVAAHGTMEDLPEDSFAAAGTNVRTVLVVLDKPANA